MMVVVLVLMDTIVRLDHSPPLHVQKDSTYHMRVAQIELHVNPVHLDFFAMELDYLKLVGNAMQVTIAQSKLSFRTYLNALRVTTALRKLATLYCVHLVSINH